MSVHPDPEMLASAAMPGETVSEALADHIRACRACRGEVETMRTLAGLVREADDAPPPAPPGHVWEGIVAELVGSGELETGPRPADTRPVPVFSAPPARSRARPGARWRRLVGPAAAGLLVAALVAAGAAGVRVSGPPATPVVTASAQLDPLGRLDPRSSGSVQEIADDGGRSIAVRLVGVTDLAGGDHLEAWLMRPDGSGLISLGNLAADGSLYRGQFVLPANLPLNSFPFIDISAEKWDGNPEHSRISLLRGRLT